jgi:rhodanese-related sulfurtransferase
MVSQSYRTLSFVPIAKSARSSDASHVTHPPEEEAMPEPLAATKTGFIGQPASSEDAIRHFTRALTFETDCWDVSQALQQREDGFVVLDVRSPQLYATGHVPGAQNLPSGRIVERNLEAYPPDTVFVVYCNGPHCNGADRAALRLAQLGRPVKKMIGGIEGWKDEGLGLATD